MSDEDDEESYFGLNYHHLDPIARSIRHAEKNKKASQRAARKRISAHEGRPTLPKYRRRADIIAQALFDGAHGAAAIASIIGLAHKTVERDMRRWKVYIDERLEFLWAEHNQQIGQEIKSARQKTVKKMIDLREKADTTVETVMGLAEVNPSAALKAAEYVHGLLGIHEDEPEESNVSKHTQEKLLADTLGLVSKVLGRTVEQPALPEPPAIEVEAEVVK